MSEVRQEDVPIVFNSEADKEGDEQIQMKPGQAQIIAEPSADQQMLAQAPLPAIEPGSDQNQAPIEEI